MTKDESGAAAPETPVTAVAAALRECLRSFLDARRAEATAENTLDLYERTLRRFIEWVEATKPKLHSLIAIDRHLTEDYSLYLATYEDEYGRPLKAATRVAYLSSLRVFCAWLEAAGKVLRSPARELRLPKVGKPVPRGVLTVDEVKSVLRVPDLKSAQGLRDRAVLELLYASGVRASELSGLDLEDLDFGEGLVTVRHGKGGKGRVVPMGRIAAQYLKRYLEEARPKLLTRGADAAVFISRFSRRMSRDRLETALRSIGKTAGLTKPLTPHGLRHTCATHLLNGRADVRHVQELLGHKSLQTTQIYTHVAAADLKRVHARCHPRERGR
jgi:integrase/recombinase XerD